MKLKVCGLKNFKNIIDVLELNPDFVGFIYYKYSKRYVGECFETSGLNNYKRNTKFVGVFVDEPIEKIKEIGQKNKLDFIQLHGNESVEYCKELSKYFSLIKTFSIADDFNFEATKDYETYCKYFLFDTFSKEYGGSGKAFDWQLLKKYSGTVPFFLSGGIDINNIPNIKKHFPEVFAIDVNSKFEIEPAQKNINLLKQIKCIK